MKIIIYLFLIILSFNAVAQVKENIGILPDSYKKGFYTEDIDHITIPSLSKKMIEDDIKQKEEEGGMYTIGRLLYVDLTPENSGTWIEEENGTKIWRLRLSSEGAVASGVHFEFFKLATNSQLFVYDPDYKNIFGPFTHEDNPLGLQYSIGLLSGDDIIIEYILSPKTLKATLINEETSRPDFKINAYFYAFRGENLSTPSTKSTGYGTSCNTHVNINCSEGDNWRNQQKGVARIFVVDNGMGGYCTGSLINNTSNDGTPYFLTADHCGSEATASDLLQWRFDFHYESSGCTSTNEPSKTSFTGCTKRSAGFLDGGSDFMLVELQATANQIRNANIIYNGWRNDNTASPSGVGIHHPSGDIKKISTYTSSLTSMTYYGVDGEVGGTNAHWNLKWISTANGYGITEPGSSGSPLFDNNGYIVGTLSGGNTECGQQVGTGNTLYGKMSYHWTSNGTLNSKQLKPWLDPGNTGITICTPLDPSTPGEVVADFTANKTVVFEGEDITFSDISTGAPTGWSWVFEGGNPSTSTSRNPTVTYNNTGIYSVSLTVSNSFGSDIKTKTNYITVEKDIYEDCSHITNIGELEDLHEYTTSTGDYITGHNTQHKFSEFAEYFKLENFDIEGDNYIQNIKLTTLIANAERTNSKITVKIWNVNNSNPGSTIYTEDFLISGFTSESIDDITLSEPVVIPSEFFIGYQVYYNTPRDDFALYATVRNKNSSIPSTMRLKYNNAWYKPADLFSGDNTNVSLAIYPQICPYVEPVVAQFSTDKTSGCDNLTVQFNDQSSGEPTSWLWNFGDGNSSTEQNPTHTYNAPGTFTVSLTVTKDGETDIYSKTDYIQVYTTPGSITITGGEDTQCGGIVTLTANGGENGIIYWQGIKSDGTDKTTASQSQDVSESGTYYFRAESNGCWSEPAFATVTINTVPEIVNVSGGGNNCEEATLTATGGTGGTIYWQGTQSNGESTEFQTINQTVATDGTYYFRAMSEEGCWGEEGSAIVVINEPPGEVTVTGGEEPQCGGTVTLTASGGENGTIYWQGTQSDGTDKTTASQSQNISESGTYYFRAESNGCWSEPASATVTINPLPTPDLGADIEVCANEITLDLSTAFDNYLWNNGEVNRNITVSQSGIYSVTVTNQYGCTGSDEINVILKEPVVISVSSTPETGVNLSNGTATVDVSQVTNPQILWSNQETTATITGLSKGTYSVTVTNEAGCNTSQSTSVALEAAPEANFSADKTSGCDNLTVKFTDGSLAEPTEWAWSFGDGNSSNEASPTHTYNQPGTYTVKLTVKNSYGQDDITKDDYIIIGETPSMTYNVTDASGSNTADGNIELIITGGSEPYTINWHDHPDVNSAIITDLLPGTYKVTVTEANNCHVTENITVNYNSHVETETLGYLIYPNPVTDILIIEFDTNIPETIRMINLLGDIIYQSDKISTNMRIDVSNYKPGTYLIELKYNDIIKTHKIIIK